MGILDDVKKEMGVAIDHLVEELKNIRSGRANPGLLDSVVVEVYGTEMRLKDLAGVTAPEARQLLVSPFDASTSAAIGKGIEKANLGVQVITEANLVRVVIPQMDEAMRKEMVKLCHRKCEEGKVSIRNVRRKYNDQARKEQGDGEITEDQLKGLEKKIQTVTDDSCKKSDELAVEKEKDILAI